MTQANHPQPTGVMCICCGHESFKSGGKVLCDYCFRARIEDSRHECKPVATCKHEFEEHTSSEPVGAGMLVESYRKCNKCGEITDEEERSIKSQPPPLNLDAVNKLLDLDKVTLAVRLYRALAETIELQLALVLSDAILPTNFEVDLPPTKRLHAYIESLSQALKEYRDGHRKLGRCNCSKCIKADALLSRER